MLTLDELEGRDAFVARHIGPDAAEQAAMCAAIGVKDRAELIAQTVPDGIRLSSELPLPAPMNKPAALATGSHACRSNMLSPSIGLIINVRMAP